MVDDKLRKLAIRAMAEVEDRLGWDEKNPLVRYIEALEEEIENLGYEIADIVEQSD